MSLLYGSFSDRYGRIPTLALPWAGCVVFSALACIHVALDNGYWLFILGASLFGLTGNFVTYVAGTFALVADLTPVRLRSIAIVALDAVLGFSLVLGNLSSGYFIRAVGYKVPIYTGACLLFLSGVFFFFLREPQRAAPVRVEPSIAAQLRFFLAHVRVTVTAKKDRTIVSAFFLGAFFLQVFNYIGSFNITTLYLLNAPFCFSTVKLGVFLAIQGCFFQLGSAGTAWILQHRASDYTLACLGFLSFILANILRGLASSFAFPNAITLLIACKSWGRCSKERKSCSLDLSPFYASVTRG